MARYQLTQKELDAAKPAAKEYLLADGDDLYLRVRTTGHRSWLYVYSLAGRKKYTLGPYPTISLAKARELVEAARQLVAANIHPADEDKRKAAEAKARSMDELAEAPPTTVNELFAKWESGYLATNHKDRGALVKGSYRKYVAPVIGDILLDQLRPRHISAVLDKASSTGVERTCGVLLGHLRQMCQYALPREWLPGDPTAGLKKSSWNGVSVERERHLTADEIIELDKALRASSLPARWQIACLLILATGTRVGETLLAKREHIDLDKKRWLIPIANQKKTNRAAAPKDFWIDLSPFAVRQMSLLISLAGDSAWLFPASGGKTPVDEKTMTKAIKDRQRDAPIKGRTQAMSDLKLSGGPWTPHDLRRTMSTLMGEMRIDAAVIDRCQNHVEPNKIRRTYQRHELRDAMREAWMQLGTRLDDLMEDI